MQPKPETLTSLRNTTILAFVPGLILNLIHGIVSGRPFPALGIIPLFLSLLLSLHLLHRDKISYGGSPISLSAANVLFVDIGLAVFYLAMLIPSWIVVPGHWADGPQVMLGTYGTVPLMVNACVHAFLVWWEIGRLVRQAGSNDGRLQRGNNNNYGSSRDGGEYTPLTEPYQDVETETTVENAV